VNEILTSVKKVLLKKQRMKHIKRTTAEKKKEAAKPRYHPRTKPEKIELKKPVPDQDLVKVRAKESPIADHEIANKKS
jgi:hypothetical protein